MLLRSRLQGLIKTNIRLKTVIEEAKQAAKGGNLELMASKLVSVMDEADNNDGLDSCQTIVLNILHNFGRLRRGGSYSQTTKDFYQMLNVWGGPRLVEFVATNLSGPGKSTVHRWQTKDKLSIKPGITESNFVQLAECYKAIVATLPHHCRSVVFAAEDETQQTKQVALDISSDTGVGW